MISSCWRCSFVRKLGDPMSINTRESTLLPNPGLCGIAIDLRDLPDLIVFKTDDLLLGTDSESNMIDCLLCCCWAGMLILDDRGVTLSFPLGSDTIFPVLFPNENVYGLDQTFLSINMRRVHWWTWCPECSPIAPGVNTALASILLVHGCLFLPDKINFIHEKVSGQRTSETQIGKKRLHFRIIPCIVNSSTHQPIAFIEQVLVNARKIQLLHSRL